MSAAMEPGDVREALGLGTDAEAWLTQLAALGPPPEPVVLPHGDEARALLRRLDVPDRDADEIVAAVPAVEADPALWWLLERTQHSLGRDVGGFGELSGGPTLPYDRGDPARYFYVYVFLAALPAVRRFHADRGIPDDVAWGTLDQLGEMVAIHRRKFGGGGMNTQFWLTLHLRGVIYRLGRLQFNLEHQRTGDPVLNTHIPEVGGPMTPQACDESFRRARPFYDRYFPEHGARVAVCTSWLLDPQLAEYLPESSNIVAFMRRWTLVDDEPQDGDESMLEFVFRRDGQPLAELPQRTSLERAAVAHLQAGRHWHVRKGRLTLP